MEEQVTWRGEDAAFDIDVPSGPDDTSFPAPCLELCQLHGDVVIGESGCLAFVGNGSVVYEPILDGTGSIDVGDRVTVSGNWTERPAGSACAAHWQFVVRGVADFGDLPVLGGPPRPEDSEFAALLVIPGLALIAVASWAFRQVVRASVPRK
jgi:hypothetical protein